MTKAKILIVDDEPFNVDYLEQEIEEAGYNTLIAFNGREALDRVQVAAPDLILLDIMMPVMDGFEVLSRLKANPATRDLPVIIISANNDLRSVVRGIQLGAEDYLPKPFEPILLQARLSSSLEKKRLRDLQQLYLKSLERELEIAREIQLGFLPLDLPRVAGLDIAAYFKAAREVAGDFYDVFLLPDGNPVCVIGDVCGKGVGAALFMTLFRSLIRATATRDVFCHGQAPAISLAERLTQAISATNNYIATTHAAAAMFATVFIGAFDLQAGTLTYLNCGNEPPLVLSADGTITTLQPTGPIVGVIPEALFCAREISMAKEDRLVAYTDGIPDALNYDNVSFGTERLLDLVQDKTTSSADLVEHIETAVQHFIGAVNQFDDITLMVVRKDM